MKRLLAVAILISGALLIGGLSPIAAQKNFVSPTYRGPAAGPVVPHEMTAREARKLAATAEEPADHIKLARYYNGEADRLEAQAGGYEEAAASLRDGPFVKNLMSPTAPARYEFIAGQFREEAASDRNLATVHERAAIAFTPLR